MTGIKNNYIYYIEIANLLADVGHIETLVLNWDFVK